MDILALLTYVKMMVLYLSFLFSTMMFFIQFESLTTLILQKIITHLCGRHTAAPDYTFAALNSLKSVSFALLKERIDVPIEIYFLTSESPSKIFLPFMVQEIAR